MSNFFEHIQDGISQLERQLEALAPDYVKVDERSPQELLQLLTHLSSQFNYYDFQNRINGNWEEFFHADLVVMLITAGALDFSPFEAAFLRIREDLHNATGDDTLFEHTRALFLLLYRLGMVLMDTLRKLQQSDKSYRIWSYLEQVMDTLEDDMIRLHRFEYQVIQLFPRQIALHGHRLRPLEMTQALRQLYTRAFENPGEGTEVFEGFFSLNAIYDTLRSKFYQITSSAPYYLKNELKDMQHSPHMGLILTFIELYGHLQQLINHLPKRHLDFYYRQVLGLEPLKAMPDRVHLFLEAAPLAHTFTIEKGQLLLATTPTRKEPLLYTLLDNVKVHNVKIMSLHTLFVSDYLQITAPPGARDIREAQAYLAVHPVIPAADYEKESTVITPWPVLGEDQHDLSASRRTMMDTDMGFIIGSPVMYLHDGNRKFHIKLFFEQDSFAAFAEYVRNFVAVTGRNESVLLSQLLSGAFLLYYTTEKGWDPINYFSVNSNIDSNTDHCIDISFVLDARDKGWSNFDSKVHGDGITSALPLLKVLLNNASFHHPYSFLRGLLLERVHVKVNVTGHKYFKLQNNIGPLNQDQSFLIFGPQPYVGAYLDIKNSNIFNRFTQDFTIQLEWLNLPRDINGFNAYYEAYEAGLENTAFKVGISSLENGRYSPERSKQQLLPLFNTVLDREGNSYLSDITVLRDVDFDKLSFTNDMLMNAEWVPDVSIFREGGVRLELAAPAEAFGHRLFGQVFPEVVMYNAQKGWLPRKKKLVPNMPYSPMLQSISISYTLEHMEALRIVQDEADGDGLDVFHAMPSGNRKIYPTPGGNFFSLLPVAQDMANLCIGFDKLYANEELALLFQLEEKHYSAAAGGVTPLKWSYLDNNQWIPFERTQLLSDDTNNLLKSGIIKIRVPPGVRNGNTMLDPALYWIRISSAVDPTGNNPRVIGVFPNAVVAERLVTDDGQSLNEALSIAPFSIKKFKTDIKSIQQVWQPFASFGGRQKETETQYYTRVSERLRHKQRPMLGVDIAQVLLQEFPELLIVKSLCIDGSRLRHMPEQPDVSIIVVPAPPKVGGGQYNTLEPKVDLATLYRIQGFIQRAISPFVKAEIRNPVYERVKVVCKVRFTGSDDYNDNLYLQKLHEDIKHYLCPWLFDAEHNFKVGSVLYTSEMLNFINRLPYVDYVTSFSLVHFFIERDPRSGAISARAMDTAVEEVAFIAASVPEGVLIPVHEHLITVLETPVYEQASALGIDGLQVSTELLVGKDKVGNQTPPADPLDEERLTITIQPK